MYGLEPIKKFSEVKSHRKLSQAKLDPLVPDDYNDKLGSYSSMTLSVKPEARDKYTNYGSQKSLPTI
jgi:hypothetical protein